MCNFFVQVIVFIILFDLYVLTLTKYAHVPRCTFLFPVEHAINILYIFNLYPSTCTCTVSHPYVLNPSLFALFSNILLGWSVDQWRLLLPHWGRRAAGMDPEQRFGRRSRYYQHRLHRRAGAFTSCSFHQKSIHYTQPVCNTHSSKLYVAPNRMLVTRSTMRMLFDQTCVYCRINHTYVA